VITRDPQDGHRCAISSAPASALDMRPVSFTWREMAWPRLHTAAPSYLVTPRTYQRVRAALGATSDAVTLAHVDYEKTLLLLDAIEGTFAIVYPAGDTPDPTRLGVTPFWASGILKRDRKKERGGALARRLAMANVAAYRKLRPELNLGGDMPLEAYERQAAHYTFEGMDEEPRYAGFSLWRHEFTGSEWLDLGVRPDWLWIGTTWGGVVVVAEWPGEVGSTSST
jgi:hypothetical protein